MAHKPISTAVEQLWISCNLKLVTLYVKDGQI